MTDLILALDEAEFIERTGISVSLDEPVQHQLDTLRPGGDGAHDEGRIWISNVLYDQNTGKYRMWYTAYPKFTWLDFPRKLAYAESTDAVHWTKPDLGLVEYNGSTHNNILPGLPDSCDLGNIIQDDDGTYLAPVNNVSCITKDMIHDPALRQEMENIPLPALVGIARSRDGFHWLFEGNGQEPVIMEKLETVRLSKYRSKYLICGQQMRPWCDSPLYERMVSFWESDDLKTWRKLPNFYHACGGVQSHIGIAALGEYGNTLLALSGRFTNNLELPDQFMEVDLLYANKDLNFRQVDCNRPYLRRGPVGSWNCGSILQAQGCIEIGDEMIFYFSGGNNGNCPVGGVVRPGYCRIKRHRFAYAGLKVGWDLWDRNKVRTGTMVSRMLKTSSPAEKIYLNCSNFVGNGQIRCALLDNTMQEIPHFSLSNAIPITAEGIDQPIQWESEAPLPERFHLKLELIGGVFRSQSPRIYAITLR